MTDIDAIRKRDDESTVHIFDDGDFRARSPSDKQTLIHDRRQLLLAYDAKCEELARERGGWLETARQLEALAVKHDALRAERDAAHREKAAAMGLVEGHALTIAKLEAERDAAVRDAQRYRWLRQLKPNAIPVESFIDAQLAAIAPPTEQPTEQPKVAPITAQELGELERGAQGHEFVGGGDEEQRCRFCGGSP